MLRDHRDYAIFQVHADNDVSLAVIRTANDISWPASMDLDDITIGICFAKRCFRTVAYATWSCLRNAASNQPEIAVRYGCVRTANYRRAINDVDPNRWQDYSIRALLLNESR